ncbi:MAG: 3-oxoacyl-[acyl-carrier-protein] reductase [Desulfobacterales bacterium]|nr:3-oxoacyl-[acyl-carrier-protein] reductase [Desulfobacterales bacterium]
MNDEDKKTIIITGGTKGIGKACCMAFAKLGYNIVFTYITDEEQAFQCAETIKELGGSGVPVRADIKDIKHCREVVNTAKSKFGHIDTLVNNAGITQDVVLFMMKETEWEDVINTNLNGTFNMCKSVITSFLKQKSGCIINMSSVAGLSGVAGQTNYCTSKAGIIGFTKSLAKELGAYEIRVNAICPGFIETGMTEQLKENIKEDALKSIPFKRFGRPDEVASLCVFLASEQAQYITGETIKIDGGLI